MGGENIATEPTMKSRLFIIHPTRSILRDIANNRRIGGFGHLVRFSHIAPRDGPITFSFNPRRGRRDRIEALQTVSGRPRYETAPDRMRKLTVAIQRVVSDAATDHASAMHGAAHPGLLVSRTIGQTGKDRN
jgi:hypothetical protein